MNYFMFLRIVNRNVLLYKFSATNYVNGRDLSLPSSAKVPIGTGSCRHLACENKGKGDEVVQGNIVVLCNGPNRVRECYKCPKKPSEKARPKCVFSKYWNNS